MAKAPSLLGRSLLALLLMFGFYVLALGVCGVGAAILWAEFHGHRIHGRILLFVAITIAVILWSIVPRPLRFPDPGIRLRRDAQPGLFALVDEIARAAGQAPPGEMFLVADVNAFVAQRGSILGFFGTRVLGVGLPLLQMLTVPQLRGVIAHEFGHFHGGDTRLGPFLYRTRAAIGLTVQNLGKAGSFLQAPFRWYGLLFLRITHAISRRQEFAADALSVRLVGREPVQTALRRVNEVAGLWQPYLETEFVVLLNANLRPPLAAGFGMFLRSPAISRLAGELGERAMQAGSDPFDTHPPLSERLAAAAAVADPGPERADGPLAISVLRDVDAVERDLLAFMTSKPGVRDVPPSDWARGSATAIGGQWQRVAEACAPKLPTWRVGEFAALGSELEDAVARTRPSVPAAERRGAGVGLLGILLGHALVRAGFRIETGPGEPIGLVRGETRIVPYELAEQLAAGTLTAAVWQAVCERERFGDVELAGATTEVRP